MSFVNVLRAAALALASLLVLPAVVSAHEYKAGTLELIHPWTRATAPGAAAGGGFLTIKNHGSEADRLVSGSSAFAEKTQIHEMTMDGETMKMRELTDGLVIPAGGEVVLKPGSFHVMFMGLKTSLTEGDNVKGTLTFEKAGTVAVEWKVEAKGAGAPAAKDGHGMSDMPGMKPGAKPAAD